MILSPIVSFALWCVIISSRTSRFCHSKVIEMEVAENIFGELFGISLFLEKNLMFLKQTVFVLLSPVTSEYSHDLMQKKNASTWSQAIVLSCIWAVLDLDCL